MGFFKKLFGTTSEKEVRALDPIVKKIEALEEPYKALTDAQLQAKTPEFKERLRNGETLEDILPEAFAAARGSHRVGRRSERTFAVRSLLDGPMRNRATGRSSFIVIREAETGTRFPSFRSRSPAPAMPAPRAACRQRTLCLWPCGCG